MELILRDKEIQQYFNIVGENEVLRKKVDDQNTAYNRLSNDLQAKTQEIQVLKAAQPQKSS